MQSAIKMELEAIRKKAGGVLNPPDVVEFAKNPKTALHMRFEWDDTKAAAEYRLWQAREIIRVCVTVLPQDNKPIRAYVSLVDDRGKNGYRSIGDVMADPERRSALIDQALRELNQFQAKYRRIKELSPVFDAAKRVQKSHAANIPSRQGVAAQAVA